MRTLPTDRSGEQGMALVMALLMVLAVSVVTGSLVMVARSEALSSTSYTSMSQVRYGAESGVHAAANYLLNTYALPSAASATDPFTNYNMAVSPVRFNNADVVLSSDPAIASNYPDAAVVNAFVANSVGNLNVNGAPVAYSARATLISMSTVVDYYTQQPITLQTWRIEGVGRIAGSGQSQVEVEATLETRPTPVFSYAAFATDNSCNAMSFAGGANTHSYDSANLAAGISDSGGNIGTNGSLDGNGGTTEINGTLSTPRSGVGNCTANNVTAATISGFATVEEGLVQLPQPITLQTPPVPTAGTTDYHFTSASGCTGAPFCVMIPYGTPPQARPTIVPPTSSTVIPMHDVDLNGSSELHLRAGIYEVNSLVLNGGAKIKVDSGPVIIKVKGDNPPTLPLDLSGGGISNPSLDPTMLQFVYAGTGDIKITGGSETAALVYAPNASGSFSGASTEFYGAVITKYVTSMGGFTLNYDRRLQNKVMTAGPPMMTAFTWKTF
jgi:hypothetical protein